MGELGGVYLIVPFFDCYVCAFIVLYGYIRLFYFRMFLIVILYIIYLNVYYYYYMSILPIVKLCRFTNELRLFTRVKWRFFLPTRNATIFHVLRAFSVLELGRPFPKLLAVGDNFHSRRC